MYCKLFASLYQGTLRGRSHEILVFTNLLANADQFGYVDKHFKAIAEEVGLTQDEVRTAIENLEAPDSESRSPELDGARIVKMDEHRIWGWKIVNYGKYRAIKNEDDRREQNRAAQERFRNKSKQSKPPSAQAEAEAEAYSKDKRESGAPLSLEVKFLFDGWNSMAERIGLPKSLTLSDKRRRMASVRLNDPFFKENWRSALARVSQSKFCLGESERGWRASFDWFITPDAVVKVMEGKYDSASKKEQNGY